MTNFGSFSTLGGQPGTYNSGPADGNYPGVAGNIGLAGVGRPKLSHPAVVVGAIVIIALLLLIFGVIGARASGEVVI